MRYLYIYIFFKSIYLYIYVYAEFFFNRIIGNDNITQMDLKWDFNGFEWGFESGFWIER